MIEIKKSVGIKFERDEFECLIKARDLLESAVDTMRDFDVLEDINYYDRLEMAYENLNEFLVEYKG